MGNYYFYRLLTVDHILAHIAEDIRLYSGKDRASAIEEFLTGITFAMHLAVTTNVEETGLDFMQRYGIGHAYHFAVDSYEHARELAADLYFILKGFKPDMQRYNGLQFPPKDKLYLYVYFKDVDPALG